MLWNLSRHTKIAPLSQDSLGGPATLERALPREVRLLTSLQRMYAAEAARTTLSNVILLRLAVRD